MMCCPILYIFRPTIIKFVRGNFHEIFMTDCAFCESQQSEGDSLLYLEASKNLSPFFYVLLYDLSEVW
jgi:hypothetical protein